MFQKIGFLAFCFVGMTMLNLFVGGKFISASDVSIMNTLTITHSQTVFKLFTIPVLNTDFFLVGIPRLVKWDYSFFGGNAAIFQYFLYSLTFALTAMLFLAIVGVMFQFYSRR